MIFEPSGDLLLEPNNSITIDKATSTINRLQKYSDLNSRFSAQNQDGETLHYRNHCFVEDKSEDPNVPGRFWLNEAECSVFRQYNLGLEACENNKMSSLPKSFTPFSLSTGGIDTNLNNGSTTDSIWLRKCESLNSTPSQYFFNGIEPNNNNSGVHPIPLSKLILFNPKGSDIFQEEEEKENWSGEGGWMKNSSDQPDTTSVSLNNAINNNNNNMSPSRCNYFWNNVCNSISDHNQEIGKDGEYDNILNGVSFSAVGSSPSAAPNLISSSVNHRISTSPIVQSIEKSPKTAEITSTDASITKRPFPLGTLSESDYKSSFCQYQEWKSNLSQWDDENQTSRELASGNNTNVVSSVDVSEPLYVNVSVKELDQNGQEDSEEENELQGGVGTEGEGEDTKPQEEMDTLLTFLSKFDEKVAAIWGQDVEGLQRGGVIGFSSQNTPVINVGGGCSNPWGSPTNNPHSPSDDAHHQLFDFRAMQNQLQYQQKHDSEGSVRNDVMYGHGRRQVNVNKSNRLVIGGNRPSPPKGKHTIMHSMREYFGTAPPESDYHIIRQVDFPESEEETQKSLNMLNHSESSSGFVVFVADVAWGNDNSEIEAEDVFGQNGGIPSEYDLDGEDELEIVVACSKPKGKPLIQVPPEDLLNSWKTHFRTVGSLEAKGYTEGAHNGDNSSNQNSSPINSSGLSAHQINPHLPHFRTFNGDDEDYCLLSKRSCDNSYFPVRFKIRRENEKGNQTMNGKDLRELSYHHPEHLLGGFDWEGYLPSQPLFPSSLMPQDHHSPLNTSIFDYDSGLQLKSSNWHTGEKAVGGEMELDYLDNQSEYYDDMFADYEGDYDFLVGGCASGGGNSTSGIAAYNTLSTSNENDTDFGHFQGFGGIQSSVSGKQSKVNRRRTRIRPCKYYFLEGSCRRGNDCKFSHDLITITCRYWAEGSCLKGSSCPFLHCFLDSKDMAAQDEFGSGALAQDKKYQLESESDFPALGSTNANAMMSSRVPMSMGFPTLAGEYEGGGLLGQCTDESYENLMIFLTTPPVTTAEEDINHHKKGLFLFERMSSPLESNSIVGAAISEPLLPQKSSVNNGQINVNKNQLSMDSQNIHSGRGKSEGPAEGSVRSTAISKSSSHNSNNWICSMISVKEKRKKKKH